MYRQITDIESDVEEVREQAIIFINNLLDGNTSNKRYVDKLYG